MKSYKTIIAMSVAGLACSGAANAALITGSMAVADSVTAAGGSYTSSSLTMNAQNLITGTPSIPGVSTLSDLTAYSTTITGLSTTAETFDIANFLVFSTTDGTFGGSGTTPGDRYTFTLTGLTETTYSGALGADFYGTGTLIDTTGALQDTAASFTLGFSGEGNYSFSFATTAAPVPEPTTIAAGALMLLPFGIGAIRSIRKARA
jgi:hypothetical protein